MKLDITVQGGVGTSEEHEFLLDNYKVDSVGWGSPFLLVPEASTVDTQTMDALKVAKEKDLYLSGISPLGVPFNSLRGNTNEIIKKQKIANNKPGSSCPKKFLSSNTEFTDKVICTASRKYQTLKIDELENKNLSSEEYDKEYFKITDKACLCEGLSNAALIENDIEQKGEEQGVAICPGPNMAYFSKEISLKEMVKHIYGKTNVVDTDNRPHMFIKELSMYVDYFSNKVDELKDSLNKKNEKYLNTFQSNLNNGIEYYHQLFSQFESNKENLLDELEKIKNELFKVKIPILVNA